MSFVINLIATKDTSIDDIHWMLSIQVHLMSGNFIKYIDLHIIPYY